MTRRGVLLVAFALVSVFVAGSAAQQFNPNLYQEMRWRLIGPFRAGRTVGIAGIPDQPNVFYMAPNNGGVWKSTDYGRTWHPIFDGQPTGSVGAIAVAPSDPDIIYVGSGEGLRRPDLSVGDGIYKSTDGGKTWTHLGLRDAQQISALIVDPKDPNRVFVGSMGHPYGPNAERGVFRSLDGGKTWQKVLYKDEDTGASDLAFDPRDPRKVYASLWASRRPPWSVGNSYLAPGSGLYVSTDGGTHWQQIGHGLPTWQDGAGRIGFTIAPSDPSRMYAWVEARKGQGIYRSDDAGVSFTFMSGERRVTGRASDFADMGVDPRDKDVLYVGNTSAYKSTDGGKTYVAWKGSPGGDDYHSIWINPRNPEIILLGVDQGATLTVNGGKTWSSWYNQPTAQFYHVITDNQFPYWVYGAQQESGSVGTASRSDYGEITFRDWHTVGVEEYGYVAPDPLNPAIIYGGKASRYDTRTGQTQDVSPEVVRSGKYRWVRTAPLIFEHANPHALLLGANVLFKTTNGGKSWEVISPDLTRPEPGVPSTLGVFAQDDPEHGQQRGVIYSIGPSFHDPKTIWIGTDDGVIQVTRDGGKTWSNVTPPDLTPWSKVAQIEASHFDEATAYAAINRLRLDDLRPHVYRTHDGGKTWQEIDTGLPAGAPVNTVREDPVRRGLLYAGTERSVYVSFDDGDHWQSLQLNLPSTSIRDLVVHDNDLVVGTHGRSFWILDDVAPLRQLTPEVASTGAYLFAPSAAWRMRRSTNTDTPLPPETPAGQNPPDGAILDYYLGRTPAQPVVLAIYDGAGKLVRRYSSAEPPKPYNPLDYTVEMRWAQTLRTLPAEAGMHRWVWDLHYPPPATDRNLPISAILHSTPLEPEGPRALPGEYTVKLTVDGHTLTQPLTVKMDPRVSATPAELEQQFAAEMALAGALDRDSQALEQVKSLREQLKQIRSNPQAQPLAAALEKLDAALAKLESSPGRQTQFGPALAPSLEELNGRLAAVYAAIDSADAAPTEPQSAAAEEQQKLLDGLLQQWQQLQSSEVAPLNRQLQSSGLPPLHVAP
jgi:photosystem II stability/assembly factor-like uncharacterized protein